MRLSEKQKKAIRASVRHWQKDIIDRFKIGDSVGERSSLYNRWKSGAIIKDSSAWCELCRGYAAVGGTDCDRCPYFKFYGHNCTAGHWGQWWANSCLENAEAMRDALKAMLPKQKRRKK